MKTHLLLLASLILSAPLRGQISLVRDQCNGTGGYGTFIGLGDYLYFQGGGGCPDWEVLNRTDGTAAGTNRIAAGKFDYEPPGRCVSGGHIYYGGNYQLRRLNGYTGGDELVREGPWTPRDMADLNGILIFTENGSGLWQSDGTSAGTFKFHDLEGRLIGSDGTYAYFYNPGSGIWRTDGTATGTANIVPTYYETSYINWNSLSIWNGSLYFLYAAFENRSAPWHYFLRKITGDEITDLIYFPPAELPVTVATEPYYTQKLFPTTEGLYFFVQTFYYNIPGGTVSDYSLWKTDGTEAGSYKVKTLENFTSVPGYFESLGLPPQDLQDVFFFVAKDDSHGTELWRSDGTEAGTYLLKDIYPGNESSTPREMSVIDGICYFMADDGVHGNEVWRSDGTPGGTYMVMDLCPGSCSGAVIQGAFANTGIASYAFKGRYYFAGYTPETGTELFATGGSNPVIANAHFTQPLGWCGSCEREVFKIADVNSRNQYMAYTFGDGLTTSAGKFTVTWDGSQWRGQYAEKGSSPGEWLQGPAFTSNGLNTAPKPPCTGWSNGFSLSGECATPTVAIVSPAGGPALDASAAHTTGLVNAKNAYEIPVTDGAAGEKVVVQWNAVLSRWEMLLVTPSARKMSETVLSYNPGDAGVNPPCSGWSDDYALSGDICSFSALPVTLLSFSAEAASTNIVKLNWATAREQNAGYFSVERSRDTYSFAQIAQVPAKGETDESTTYIHTDETPLRGRSYYRLRQVDLDGSHTYSKIATVRTSGTDAPYPNPARNGVIRIGAAEGATLKLTDLSGRNIPFTLKRINEELAEIHPDQRLLPGGYVISVDGTGHRVLVEP